MCCALQLCALLSPHLPYPKASLRSPALFILTACPLTFPNPDLGLRRLQGLSTGTHRPIFKHHLALFSCHPRVDKNPPSHELNTAEAKAFSAAPSIWEASLTGQFCSALLFPYLPSLARPPGFLPFQLGFWLNSSVYSPGSIFSPPLLL